MELSSLLLLEALDWKESVDLRLERRLLEEFLRLERGGMPEDLARVEDLRLPSECEELLSNGVVSEWLDSPRLGCLE